MATIDKKISTIISHFKLNNFSFSKRIGVTSTTVDSIINGRLQKDGTRKKTKPGYDVLMAIINAFDINPDYLFGKSAVMLRSNVSNNQTYSGIPTVVSTNESGNENVVFVPVQASAGYLNGYGDPEYIESLPAFRMPKLLGGSYRCFEVKGKSMLNTFYEGDLVFGAYVENLRDIKDDDVHVIVSKSEGVVLKRVINKIDDNQSLILISDNKDGNYPDYSLKAEDIKEIWRVTMYASRHIPADKDLSERIHQLEHKIINLEELLQRKLSN